MPLRVQSAGDAERLPSLSVVQVIFRACQPEERALSVSEYPELETIVVDDGSPVPLGGLGSEVQVVRNDGTPGFAGACNRGIAESSSELVLLLNDDTVPEPGALRALVDALVLRPAWGACQAKLLLLDDPERMDTAGSFLTATGFLAHRGAFEREDRFRESDVIFAAKGAALLLRRRALADVGAFDPDYFAYFEETDLCWRLWLAGWEVGFAAEARILHALGATAGGLPASLVQFHSFKNRVCTLLKNLGGTRLAWMLPLHVFLCVALAGWYSARGQSDIGRAILRALTWNARNLTGTLRKRAEIQSRRRVSDRELMPRITVATPVRTLLSYASGTAAVRARTRDPS